MHVDEVKQYYEKNTRRFLSLGQGGAEGAIHRAVWGEGVQDLGEAVHFVHELVLREAHALGSPLRVLDLGCGVGACLSYLSERIAMDGIGITLSPLQVELGRTRVAGQSIELMEGNFEALPPIEEVDLATAIESFVHGSHPERFMQEVARVLRPGGRLVMCDDFLARPALEAGPAQRELLQDFRHGWHLGTLDTVDAVDRIARQHGLELLSDMDLSPSLALGRLRDRAVSTFVRLGKWAGATNKYFQAMRGGNALHECLRSGLVEYRFVVWKATGS